MLFQTPCAVCISTEQAMSLERGEFRYFKVGYEEEGDGICGINLWAIYPGLEGLKECSVSETIEVRFGLLWI